MIKVLFLFLFLFSLGLFSLSLISSLLFSCDSFNQTSQKYIEWKINKNCDLNTQSCTSKNGSKQVTISISPTPIPIAKTLNVIANFEGLNISKLQLDISGTNMYMGYNRVSLNKLTKNNWTGTAILAFCPMDKMEWKLTLIADTVDGMKLRIPFYLATISKP